MKKVDRLKKTTRKNISKKWEVFARKKVRIEGYKKISDEGKKQRIEEERERTKRKISDLWQSYDDFKKEIQTKSEITGFHITRIYRTENTLQKTYQARSNYNTNNLDSLVPELLENKKVAGVVVIIKGKNPESEETQYCSDFMTKSLLARLEKKNQSIYDHVLEKLHYSKSGGGEYEEENIYIRIVYEKD